MFPSQVKHAEAEPPRFTLSPPLKELLSDDAAAEQPRFVERVTMCVEGWPSGVPRTGVPRMRDDWFRMEEW